MAGLLLRGGALATAAAAAAEACPIKVGSVVERAIDDAWFRARVTEVDAEIEELSVVYLDDGNKEVGVSFDDVRIVDASPAPLSPASLSANTSINAGGKPSSKAPPPQPAPTLKKPLAGLVEDDWQERQNHVPTAVVHNSHDTEEAIILNGADNELAAGGGLRALRFIKKQSS